MSKISLSGPATGTATFTITTPAGTSTDRTLTLPDEAGTVLTSASTVAASQITGALNASGSAPVYACRSWVNFNGTGTVAIRASGNVSSITDNGTGDYTVNFTTAMPDVNYSAVGCAGGTDSSIGDRQLSTYPLSTTTCRLISGRTADVAKYDAQQVMLSIFR